MLCPRPGPFDGLRSRAALGRGGDVPDKIGRNCDRCLGCVHSVHRRVRAGGQRGPGPAHRPRTPTALPFMISGTASSLMPSCSKSPIHRSGVMSGKSEPNSALCLSIDPIARVSCGGKYFGDHPDRSMKTLALWVAIEIEASAHGTDGWARIIVRS